MKPSIIYSQLLSCRRESLWIETDPIELIFDWKQILLSWFWLEQNLLSWFWIETDPIELTWIETDSIELTNLGTARTYSLIRHKYCLPRTERCIRRYVFCLACMCNNEPTGKRPGILHPIPKLDVPLHTIHIDHLGPFVLSTRNQAICVVLFGLHVQERADRKAARVSTSNSQVRRAPTYNTHRPFRTLCIEHSE
jgi:hypothetical protein